MITKLTSPTDVTDFIFSFKHCIKCHLFQFLILQESKILLKSILDMLFNIY